MQVTLTFITNFPYYKQRRVHVSVTVPCAVVQYSARRSTATCIIITTYYKRTLHRSLEFHISCFVLFTKCNWADHSTPPVYWLEFKLGTARLQLTAQYS